MLKKAGIDESGTSDDKNLVTIQADDPIYKAAKRMADHQIRRLPVVDGEVLIGMISLGDIALEETDYQAKIR